MTVGQGAPVVHPAQAGVAVLTTGTELAADLLTALDGRGVRPAAIVLERPSGGAVLARVRDSLRRRGMGATLGALRREAVGRLRPRPRPWRIPDFYDARADRLIVVPSLAGEAALAALADVRPRLTLLAGAPILPASILDVPDLGTLNAHPGLLPRYRGVDVVAHAVLSGDAVGATVHFVDAGIDTGGIVARVDVEPRTGENLAQLQRRVERAGAELLADVAARLLADGSVPTEAAGDRHPLRRRLSAARRREADRRLRSR
jgi:methionyl-tRNA formyltransferase